MFDLFCLFVLAESGTSNNERSLEDTSAAFLHLLLVSKSFFNFLKPGHNNFSLEQSVL